METLCELIVIRNLIDRTLSKEPSLAVQAELYTSRIFLVRAIKEQTASPNVLTYAVQPMAIEKGIEA
jgi:hypothetical protein